MPRFTVTLQVTSPDEDSLYDYLAFDMIKESEAAEDFSIIEIKETEYGTAEFDFDTYFYS